MSGDEGMFYKFTILLCALFVGCSAPQPDMSGITAAAPTSANIFTPPAPATTPQPQATAAFSPENALDVFPLKRGAQWVYREIAYDTIPNEVLPQRTNRQITATLLMTDTIVDTRTRNGNYAAQVARERTVISTTMDLAQLGDYGSDYFANNAPATKWYIFAGDKIYSQFQDLDWDVVMSSTLELQLPLTEGARWYPDAEQRAQFSVDEGLPGLRAVEAAPRVRVPAGEFTDCFVLHDFYNTGGILTEFCPGVGILGEGFDHAGTPFGTHSALLKFTAGQ
jgi:hypothetical protein